MSVRENYRNVREQVAQKAVSCGRCADEVKLIAVSKTVGVDVVAQAIDAGAADFGENRPEMLAEKAAAYPDKTWHCIGNIQSRKIPQIVRYADLIHSVCDERHLRLIDAEAQRIGKVQNVLIEVNVSGEQSKSGCVPQDAAALVMLAVELAHVRPQGLMTMAPQGDVAVARETFAGLRDLHAQIRAQLTGDAAQEFAELSMGMSEDWAVAIECGATMVRIGRAVFSDMFR